MATPRNLSTALMYSFAQRKDTSVIDEPFFGVFLENGESFRPSRTETLASWPQVYDSAIHWINEEKARSQTVFLKNMASHHLGFPLTYLSEYKNIFVLRHPALIIRSFIKQVENPSIADIGLARQKEIFQFCQETGAETIVIDSELLLQNPQAYLMRLCECLQIEWEYSMLFWPKGPKKYDGPWAKYWYHNLHQSTGFQEYIEKEKLVPTHLAELYESCMNDYSLLKQYEMK